MQSGRRDSAAAWKREKILKERLDCSCKYAKIKETVVQGRRSLKSCRTARCAQDEDRQPGTTMPSKKDDENGK